MKTVFLSFILFAAPLVAQEKPSEPYPRTRHAGFVKAGRTSINLEFGIEQYEDGKRGDGRLQLWNLSCATPDVYSGQKSRFNTWCSLERIVMDTYPGEDRRIVTGHNHYTSEDTLKLTNVDFPSGKLDFSVVYDDKSTTEVMIRLKRWQDELFLESFKGISIAKGIFSDTMSAVEYRIPEYSYSVNIPVQLSGLKAADEKVRDDFETSLTAADLAIWKKISSTVLDFDEAVLKKAFPDYDKINKGERKFTKPEAEKLGEILLQQVTNRIASSALSPDGKRKAQALLSKVVQDMVRAMQKDIK